MVPELASKTEQKRMTKSEFEQWLAGHYDALVQRVGRGKRGLACEEALQVVISGLMEDPGPLGVLPIPLLTARS